MLISMGFACIGPPSMLWGAEDPERTMDVSHLQVQSVESCDSGKDFDPC